MDRRGQIPSLLELPIETKVPPPSLFDIRVPPPSFNPSLPPPLLQSPQYSQRPHVPPPNWSHHKPNHAVRMFSLPRFPVANTEQPVTSRKPILQEPDNAEAKLQTWLRKNHLCPTTSVNELSSAARQPDKSPTLLDIKIMLHKLNVLQLRLDSLPASIDGSETESAVRSEICIEIDNLLSIVGDQKVKDDTKALVMRAKNRKARLLRCQQRLAAKRQEQEQKVAESHEKLDKWLQQIQEEKRTEQMMKAADESMSGVRQKIADATRQKDLIESLIKLRSVRQHNAKQTHGSTSSQSSDDTFKQKTGGLLKTLGKRLALYRQEENALKVMLQTQHDESRAEEQRIKDLKKRKQEEKLEKKTELWLFGSDEVPEELKAFYDYYNSSETSIDTLICTRHEWDRFITSETDLAGSRIPRGWVVPSEPSSHEWRLYLTDNVNQDNRADNNTGT